MLNSWCIHTSAQTSPSSLLACVQSRCTDRCVWWGLFYSVSFYIQKEEHLDLPDGGTSVVSRFPCGPAVWEYSSKLIAWHTASDLAGYTSRHPCATSHGTFILFFFTIFFGDATTVKWLEQLKPAHRHCCPGQVLQRVDALGSQGPQSFVCSKTEH